MQSILKSDIFFFISSISIILITVIFIIIGVYLIRIMKNFSEISEKLKQSVDDATDELRDMSEHVRESAVFRFIFGHKKNKKIKPKL